MKKIYHLLALVILGAFTFTSCDDFLDMQPTNSGNAEGAVGTVADAQVVYQRCDECDDLIVLLRQNLLCTVMPRAVTSRFLLPDADWMHSIRSTTLPTAILIPVSGAVDITASAGQHLVEQH